MIGFAGLSHLGIVSSAALASQGFPVVGFDTDVALCRDLARGRAPIVEPGLPELLASVKDRLTFSPDPGALARCDVVYVSADVPTDDSGQSDLRPITTLVEQVAAANTVATVVTLSQVPPGFTRALAARDSLSLSTDRLYYQVETLIFGRAVERALHPERYIVGSATPDAPLPPQYATLLSAFGCPVLVMRYESAELAKIAINHFLAASVGMTNTLAELCETIGADWSEIAPALRLDRRIGPHAYLTPGLGIAGGNIERDLATVISLAAQQGTDAGIVQAIVGNSRHRRDWAVQVVRRALQGRSAGAQIAVWGLAYKADTASTKNSPALALVQALEGVFVRAYDPQARVNGSNPHLLVVGSPLDACREADVLAVMTPWREFAAVDIGDIKRAMRGRVIVDPFAVLDGGRCVSQGFSYNRLGRPLDA